jgi:hypothetical protein
LDPAYFCLGYVMGVFSKIKASKWLLVAMGKLSTHYSFGF